MKDFWFELFSISHYDNNEKLISILNINSRSLFYFAWNNNKDAGTRFCLHLFWYLVYVKRNYD